MFLRTQLASMLVSLGCRYYRRDWRNYKRLRAGNRATLPHKVSIFDMDMKYADVMDLDEVVGHISLI